jgi:hypothetical protein
MTYPKEENWKVEEVHEKISLRGKIPTVRPIIYKTSAENHHIIGFSRGHLPFETTGALQGSIYYLMCSWKREE